MISSLSFLKNHIWVPSHVLFSVTLSWGKFQSDCKEGQLFSDQYLFDVSILND